MDTEIVIDVLRSQVRGTVIHPGDPQFQRARRLWNAAIDREPSGIVLCADAEDVAVSLRIAADHGANVTVRGGGHNIAGRSVRDGALVIDLSLLRDVNVNPGTRIATVQGGALWRDIDSATAAAGLATTGGLVSSTGVGGFTLGGGAGWLMRKHGLAIDNLSGARVVLADGRTVWASAEEHDDLFWGLRGGAGELGVVTSFEFSLHPLREVFAGLVVYPAANAAAVLTAFRDFAAQAPDEFCGLAVIINAPPLPFLDPAWHGRPVVLLALSWCGELDTGARTVEPLRHLKGVLADHMGPMPYSVWQQMQDPGAPSGRHQYWKTANYDALDGSTVERLAVAALDLPSPESEIHLQHMGGAVGRHSTDETAFAHRQAKFFVNVLGITSVPGEFASMRARVRAFYDQISMTALPGRLPNFCSSDEADPQQQFGGDHAGRLAALRQRFDPRKTFVGELSPSPGESG
jgi:FAD/FMN-containing dehydrogenase